MTYIDDVWFVDVTSALYRVGTESEPLVNARGTGCRQSRVKAASALKVTAKNTSQKKNKKEFSSADSSDDGGEYVVERILGSLIGEKGKIWYLIKWEGELLDDQLKFLELENSHSQSQTSLRNFKNTEIIRQDESIFRRRLVKSFDHCTRL